MKIFNLVSNFNLAGDQPKAIKYLIDSTNRNERDQVLLGVTGSGKTFTMAHVIANTGRPALIMAHNKTLAAQLYEEMHELYYWIFDYFIGSFFQLICLIVRLLVRIFDILLYN